MTVIEARVRAHLHALDDRALRRTLRAPSGIDFSSNDYLGLAEHPAVTARMIDAIRERGCGSTGSRLLGGHRDVFDRVEQAFAAFKGTERALFFSSGYLANLAVLSAFAERGDVVLSDRQNHASLRDGIRVSMATRVTHPHGDLGAIAARLASSSTARQVFVVTESLFSMDGDTPPLRDYATRCREAGAALIVDEAHAVGLYGARGSGLIEETGIGADVLVSINGAGKALGVGGAFVAGPGWAIDYLIQRARPFVFSTASPPALADALLASLAIVQAEPERRTRLRDNVALMRARLRQAGIATLGTDSPIVPVILGDAARAMTVASDLHASGFDVRAVRPPTVPVGSARLRLSINVKQSADDIHRLVDALALSLEGSHPCPAVSS